MPSRRLYVSRRDEYEEIMKVKARKNRLSLKGKKRLITYSAAERNDDTDDEDTSIFRVERKLTKVKSRFLATYYFDDHFRLKVT